LFDKVHVTGATTSCPGDISSNDSSDDDVAEVHKTPDSDDVKLAALKRERKERRNTRSPPVLLKTRKRGVHSFEHTRTHV
jgi:hypothetical protein